MNSHTGRIADFTGSLTTITVAKNGQNMAWTTFGRYALLEKIGAGGMAEIYRAKTFGAAGFEKEFAIKLILPALVGDKEFVGMFINEAKIAVSLYHANVVQVFDLGQLDSQYYIAMEYVHGKDLLDVLARCANLNLKIPLDIVLFITMEYLKGLDFAHRAKNAYGDDLNIIHRDVSPSNVLISYAGDVKIGDFGVAKAAIQRNMTESGTLKGKVGYMSPEQVIGEEIDSRSDVFSAGIVFFEALSMSRLFIGNSDLDVMLRVRDADIDVSIAKSGPWPASLDELIRKALAKHREERYQTAGEFYQALMDFCYQHRIKVTGTDLSNFMCRLFAAEIEQEKNRRLSEEENNNKSRPPMPVSEAKRRSSNSFVGKMPAIEEEVISESHVEEIASEIASEPSVSFAEEVSGEQYRYRDEAGLIFGPMGQKTLVKLLNDRPPESEDRVSVDGADWQEPWHVDMLVGRIPEKPTSKNGASKSVPVGAAVYRPTKRPMGDEPTVREDMHHKSEAGLANEQTRLEPPENSLVVPTSQNDVPPAPAKPETSEEGKKVISQMKMKYASHEGILSRVSFARLLARLHRTSETGRLYVRNGSVEKSIYFDAGEPILVDSNQEDELLGYFLLSRDIIKKDQLSEGLARLNEWGGRLGDALVAIGAIPAHEVFKHLSEQMGQKLLQVFEWEDGNYGYFENQEPDTHGYPLGIDTWSTIVEGCTVHKPLEQIKGLYEHKLAVPIHRREVESMSVDKLRLPAKSLRVSNHFDSGDSLSNLLRKLPESEAENVYRVVYLLHQVELLTFEDTESHATP